MTPSIHIPEPCSQDWDAMTPEGAGRHCSTCALTVVDFTGWEPQAIAAYLKAQAGTRVCGRFRREQVATEQNWLAAVFSAGIPVLRKIAAAVLFFFGTVAASGCFMGTTEKRDVNSTGEVMLVNPPSSDTTTLPDTNYNHILGEVPMIAAPKGHPIKKSLQKQLPQQSGEVVTGPGTLMGAPIDATESDLPQPERDSTVADGTAPH